MPVTHISNRMPTKKTRNKKPSVVKDTQKSKVSVATVTEESFAYNLEECCTSSPKRLSRKPLSDLNGLQTMLNGCGPNKHVSGCEFTKLYDHVAVLAKERRAKMVINHMNRVDTLVKKIMMFKMSIPPNVGNMLVGILTESTDHMQDESVLEDLSKLKVAQAMRSRKKAVETKDNVFKKPGPTTILRNSSRKTKLSSSSFKTPALNRCPPSASSLIITPKVNLDTPLSVLRLPKQGEMAVSMSGSPLMVSAATRDETPSINVPLPDGKILSILPNLGFEPNEIPYLDKQTRQHLETLRSHLEVYCDRINPAFIRE